VNIPVALKLLVPGYRDDWRRQCACLIAEMAALAPRLVYNWDGDLPWIELDGVRLHGFPTERENRDLHTILRPYLPSGIPKSHFRLVKDCLTRFIYPHMRPDLKPRGFPVEAMFGFHGQHKDSIDDLEDIGVRNLLMAAFKPKDSEAFLDCGAFLGFGEIHLSRAIKNGQFYAIEASGACHALLIRNLTHNGVSGAYCIHRAVWNVETELELEASFAQANSLVRELHKGQRTERVRTISLDGAAREFALKRLDMLSLTLNGAEVEAIEGGREILRQFRPRIRLAGWYSRGGRKIWEITKQQLEELGYRVFVGQRGNVLALPKELT
jgi:FkbM family methyltransferase